MNIFLSGSKSGGNVAALANIRLLDKAIERGDAILVGDCPGADAAIQEFLADRKYSTESNHGL